MFGSLTTRLGAFVVREYVLTIPSEVKKRKVLASDGLHRKDKMKWFSEQSWIMFSFKFVLR
jgi:hypothetical protein